MDPPSIFFLPHWDLFLIIFSSSSSPLAPLDDGTSQDAVVLSDVFFIYTHTLGHHIHSMSLHISTVTLIHSKYMFLAMNSLLNLNSLLNNFNWRSNRISMSKNEWTSSIPVSPVTPFPHTMFPRSVNGKSCDTQFISFSHILYQIHPPPIGFICSPSSPPSPPALPGL